MQSPWPHLAAFAQHGDRRWREDLIFADDAIAAALLARTATARTQTIVDQPEGIGHFQRFHRCIERIGHVDLHPTDARAVRRGAHAPANRLIISKRCAIVPLPANSQIVHRALAGRGDLLGQGLGQRAQDHIDQALRGFDIATRDRSRGQRIDQRAHRRDDLHRRKTTGIHRHFVADQTAHHVITSRLRDRNHRVERPVDGRRGAAEIKADRIARNRRGQPNRDQIAALRARPLDHIFKLIDAIGPGGNGCTGQTFAVAAEMIRIGQHFSAPVRLDQVVEAACPHRVRGALRGQIPPPLLWRAHIAQNQRQQILIERTGLVQLDRRNDDAFLVDFGGKRQ